MRPIRVKWEASWSCDQEAAIVYALDTTEQRALKREVDRRHKRGSVRFVLLVLALMMTAAIVTVVMFRTLYLLLG